MSRIRIARRLRPLLHGITVSPDGTRAEAGPRHRLSAAHPAELERLLAKLVYDRFHVGNDDHDMTPSPALEEPLRASVPHRRTTAPVEVLSEEAGSADVVARIDGVRVLIPASSIRPGTGVAELPCARAALSPGFLVVDGSRGSCPDTAVLRVYVHLADPAAAPAVWARTLRILEEAKVRYRAKVLSRAGMYPRTDALVAYLPEETAPVASLVADRLDGVPGLGRGTSVFARPIADSVAVAREPVDRPGGALSFGLHRATAVAAGLIRHASGPRAITKEEAVADALARWRIDPAAPERNLRCSHGWTPSRRRSCRRCG
ncbi:T3SS effector HopA1 family protein [Nonomuraea sp. KM88]|uniref:T3SS effector HopA1 family protein n=1 Tax=Nonomuraea sp. KM88 TaxID=3457427 RepID=UPI003FCDF272